MILVTDGGWSLGMDRNGLLCEARVSPLLKTLEKSSLEQLSTEVETWLLSKEFDTLTSDDKTFVMGFRDGARCEALNLGNSKSTKIAAVSQRTVSKRFSDPSEALRLEIPESRPRFNRKKWSLIRYALWIALGGILALIGALALYFFSGFDLDRSLQSIIQKRSILQDVVPSPSTPSQPQPLDSPKEEIRT